MSLRDSASLYRHRCRKDSYCIVNMVYSGDGKEYVVVMELDETYTSPVSGRTLANA